MSTVEPYGFETKLDLPDARFRDVRENPFDLYGLYEPHRAGGFRRLSAEIAAEVSEDVERLSACTAGARVRFCTDSAYIAIHADMPYMTEIDLMTRIGTAGFDLYVLEGAHYYYYDTFFTNKDMGGKGYEKVVRFPDRRLRQVMIHFPLYSPVENLYIGLQKNAVVDHGRKYRFDKPVVYYGSSITMGGCASRPGNTYQSIISIEHDCDFLNLGFAGAAKAEPVIREYIASLDMSVFVLDYDHNAPSVDHLRNTYEPFYRTIREVHPLLPIVFVSAPDTIKYIHGDSGKNARRAVIYDVYQKALAEGDTLVRFIDGDSLFEGEHHDICTVDGCHPTDLGFIRMAEKIGHTVASLLR